MMMAMWLASPQTSEVKKTARVEYKKLGSEELAKLATRVAVCF